MFKDLQNFERMVLIKLNITFVQLCFGIWALKWRADTSRDHCNDFLTYVINYRL